MRYLLLGALLLALAAPEARAQLEATSRGSQRAANRKALQDARRFDARYKESHLVVSKQELKTEAGGRLAASPPHDGRAGYRFGHDGAPRVSEPSRLHLRLRKTPNTAPLQ
ncbi:hypothetical protein CDA63_18515 [Hymenobacter amundsenii]|uniref:Uncharacterized protein n=1 Tax=Hymenobacter amundsenii TaxID=2006685 RepID=A0A246FGF4_9BACT|nr:hypothetical protein [Hymenobacter amundsenii]OWP61609.1 hypothetical protein CDA63_18515 [Hymenobacter amundsenii]